MDASAALRRGSDARAKGERASAQEGVALMSAAGAAAGALGAVDLLLGLAMLAGAATYDATFEGAPTAQAMRAYGLRSALVGAANLAFVWAVFAGPGARSWWMLLPLALAATDLLGDASAFGSGLIPSRVLAVTAAVHELLTAAVAATVLSAWRREGGKRQGGGRRAGKRDGGDGKDGKAPAR